MATRLLVATGSVTVVPVEYTLFYPLQGAARVMDRFIPSSKQPQHWSRNYNAPQGERRRINVRRRSPESKSSSTRSYRQGVTLRAEDLLGEQKLTPNTYLSPRQGDRRAALGGSATELTKCDRPKAPLRRSSEGNYTLRRKSSSSSNAADDPTSSDHSSSLTSSASSSSESGCSEESETCSYCRLSESSDTYECPDSTDDERSSSSSSCDNTRRPSRAASIETSPSKNRPLRRSSPGEYLRHKRDQMEKLRKERLHSPARTLKRCDSDPRLQQAERPSYFTSPTRSRLRQSYQRSLSEDPSLTELERPLSRTNHESLKRATKSVLGKNIAERKSRSKERTPLQESVLPLFVTDGTPPLVVWNHSVDESTPFVTPSFTCAVCDCDMPFTNCVLCSAEAKQPFIDDRTALNDSEDVTPRLPSEREELEQFYDEPTPMNPAKRKTPPDERRTQWTSKGSSQWSFNQDPHAERRNSLRKYYSEPVPEKEDIRTLSRNTQSDTCCRAPSNAASCHTRSESSCSSSSRKSGFHVAKESPRRKCQTEEEATCDTGREDEKSHALSPDVLVDDKNLRKSPNYLRPEFVFEPEIIHKANPLVDEAEVDMLPLAREAFRRLSTDEYLSTVSIHEAAGKGDLHVVKLLTKKDTKQMETVDERGWTPIHLAAAHGHSEVVKYLAGEGAHLSALDPSSYTALHLAAMNGHNCVVEVLLPMGVDVDCVTTEGFSALHLAVMNGHLECISTLLQWGASMEKRDALGRGVYEMVEEYSLDDVAILLRKFHKQLHNFKHVLDYMKNRKEDRSTSEIPQEFMDILASIAEESGTE